MKLEIKNKTQKNNKESEFNKLYKSLARMMGKKKKREWGENQITSIRSQRGEHHNSFYRY